MGEINWTHEAEIWLRDTHDYIARDNPKAAEDTVSGIYDKTQILVAFPEAGYTYKEHSDRSIRILLYGHYRIAYLIKPNRDVDVLGVFHGALDIQNYSL